ncbi:MAG: hypothetical protein RIR33_2619 [Pseudomonadota bacterium]|jgi:hypothetical protein
METDRILAAVLDSPGSSARELAQASGAKLRTVLTVLQRYGDALEAQPDLEGSVGRPCNRYRVRPQWARALRRRVKGVAEPDVDPIVSGIEIVERSALSLRGKLSEDDRARLAARARNQVSLLTNMIAAEKDARASEARRLASAASALEAAIRAGGRPGPTPPILFLQTAAAPRAASMQFAKSLRRLAKKYDGVWVSGEEPALSGIPASVVIDAIVDHPDIVSGQLLDSLKEHGVPAVRFAIREGWSDKQRQSFFKDLTTLAQDPISCLCPLYVTINSGDPYTSRLIGLVEKLNNVGRLKAAAETARVSLVKLMDGEPLAKKRQGLALQELATTIAYFSAFVANAQAAARGGHGAWRLCPGPTYMDAGSDDDLRHHVEGLNGRYVPCPSDSEINQAVAIAAAARPLFAGS